MAHRRLFYLIITFILMGLGLASRKYGDFMPVLVAKYAGDTLWAAVVYFGLRFLIPDMKIYITLIVSLLFSYGIEISQLYQSEWINTLRSTTLGALILGHGFLWSDILCYSLGVIVSASFDFWLIKNLHSRKKADNDG